MIVRLHFTAKRGAKRARGMKVLIEKVPTIPAPTGFSNKINGDTVAACQRQRVKCFIIPTIRASILAIRESRARLLHQIIAIHFPILAIFPALPVVLRH